LSIRPALGVKCLDTVLELNSVSLVSFSEMGMHELTWLIRQPKSKDSGTEK